MKKIIARKDNKLLVRVQYKREIPGNVVVGVRYELWSNENKFKAGIEKEVKRGILHHYVSKIESKNEKKLIEEFLK